MHTIVDSALTWGTLYQPIRPPATSMLVVVKATFELGPGSEAGLADTQDPPSGPLHVDDDPEQSLRHANEYALLKPRGECFVTGSARSLTETAVERTAVRFSIGPVDKSFTIYGDRKWVRSGMGMSASPPVPFTEMPLSWERSFGGPGLAANPHGRGIDPDDAGDIWLPNIEASGSAITARDERPAPAGAFPMDMSWKSRQRYLGTYDASWQKERFPWFAEDFRFAFFNQAPEDQRIDGYWTGDETIRLERLHPTLTSVHTRLPGIRARAFVEHEPDARRAGAFEEVPLVLDTITIDADRGLALCVWRGNVELDHKVFEPEGVARLFIMDEPLADKSSVEACRRRMLAKLEADEAAGEELAGEAPPEEIPEVMQTMAAVPSPELAAAIEAASAQAEQAEQPAFDPYALLEKVKADLRAAGLDPDAEEESMAGLLPLGPLAPPDVEKVRAAFAQMGQDMPEEVEEALKDLDEGIRNPPPPYEPPGAPPPIDLRQRVLDLHRARRPLVGDFSGANLSELKLPGLDASRAILAGADFRGTHLEKACFDGANLAKAEFFLANLKGASLVGADLSHALLEAADLTGANLDGATLDHSEAAEVCLDHATLRKASLHEAILDDASLGGAICDEADFSRASLNRAKCNGASFVEARLYGTRATEVVMTRADVRRIRVGSEADLSGAKIDGAQGDGSRWRTSTLKGADFAGTTLNGADFTKADLAGANLAGCPLRGALFQGATATETRLARADVFEGSFREADLSRADLRGANLYAVDFFQAKGESVELGGANLERTLWDRK